MNKHFLNVIFLSTFIVMINACTKDTVTPKATTQQAVSIEIKEYYPPEGMDVNEKVVGFLNHTKTYNPKASFKTEFKDMEVNEAMWTLEAASNFLVNENFKYHSDPEQEVLELSLSFALSHNGREAIVSGADLTRQFEQLFTDINAKITGRNKVPKIVDFIFEEGNSEKAVFKIVVVLASDEPIEGLERIPEPFGGWGQCNRMQQVFGPCLDITLYPFTPSLEQTRLHEVAEAFKTYCADGRMAAYWSGYYSYNVGWQSTDAICAFAEHDSEIYYPEFDEDCVEIIGGHVCHTDDGSTIFNELFREQEDGSLNVLDVINDHLCRGSRKYLLDYEQKFGESYPKTICAFTGQEKIVIGRVYVANRSSVPPSNPFDDDNVIGRTGGN